MEPYTLSELYSKISWEGGFIEAVTGYGMGLDEFLGGDAALQLLWKQAHAAAQKAYKLGNAFMNRLEDEIHSETEKERSSE